ncbi:MAG: hypothetical protein ACXVCP_14015 [Bdellovibrio sp.]
MKIRQAIPGDEVAIAKVHIQSWQEAYKGLLPQDYLYGLPSGLEERINMWKRTLANPQRWTWVAESDQVIVGFVLFGPPFSGHTKDDEIGGKKFKELAYEWNLARAFPKN